MLIESSGGHDSSRLVSDMVQTKSVYGADLIDIGIGVSSGASPFANVSSAEPVGGLLQIDGKYNSSQFTTMDARYPYMYLPTSTCEAIASYLPITWNPDLALYLWDTDNPAYNDIATSPSYLSFAFQSGTSVSNATIKIPFALLNLTLLPPLAQTPTAYFPCRPLDLNKQNVVSSYYLGRAFLQQAFFAQDWEGLQLWLGQAPGPNLPSGTVQDGFDITTTNTTWEDSWAGHLTPLASTPTYLSSTGSADAGSSGLSTGAKAGIGVGVALGVLAILGIAVAVFFALRKRRTRTTNNWDRIEKEPYMEEDTQSPQELEGEMRYEPDNWREAPELPGSEVSKEKGDGK